MVLSYYALRLIEPIFYSDVTMLWENKRVPLFDERGYVFTTLPNLSTLRFRIFAVSLSKGMQDI